MLLNDSVQSLVSYKVWTFNNAFLQDLLGTLVARVPVPNAADEISFDTDEFFFYEFNMRFCSDIIYFYFEFRKIGSTLRRALIKFVLS